MSSNLFDICLKNWMDVAPHTELRDDTSEEIILFLVMNYIRRALTLVYDAVCGYPAHVIVIED